MRLPAQSIRCEIALYPTPIKTPKECNPDETDDPARYGQYAACAPSGSESASKNAADSSGTIQTNRQKSGKEGKEMIDTIEAAELVEAISTRISPPVKSDQVFSIEDAIADKDFSGLLSLRDYVNDLLAEKAEAERAALIDKSAELSGYLGLEVAELLTPPKKKSEIKYRDADGNSWTGKGPKPAWFKAAVDSGVDPETFRV